MSDFRERVVSLVEEYVSEKDGLHRDRKRALASAALASVAEENLRYLARTHPVRPSDNPSGDA